MIIRICVKCSDGFWARLLQEPENQQRGVDYDGYVPSWMPGDHDGDYVSLDIDAGTGKILNWKCPTSAQLAETFKFKRGVKVGKLV